MTNIRDSYKDAIVHEGDVYLIGNVNWKVLRLENLDATVSTVSPTTGKEIVEKVPIQELQKHKENVIRLSAAYTTAERRELN